MSLPLAGQDGNTRPADAFGFGDEGATVARVAAGGGRDRPNAPHMQNITQGAKTSKRFERGFNGVSRQQTCRLNLPPKTGENFLIEDRRRRSGQALVNNQSN